MRSWLENKYFFSSIIISLVIIFDQILKNIAPRYLSVACNKGIAFGIGIDGVFLSLVVLGIILFLLLTAKSKVLILALAMIFGGGMSNVVDRVSIGCVRDFINLGIFPSFNLADAAIVFGVILILVDLIFVQENKKR